MKLQNITKNNMKKNFYDAIIFSHLRKTKRINKIFMSFV